MIKVTKDAFRVFNPSLLQVVPWNQSYVGRSVSLNAIAIVLFAPEFPLLP